LQTIVTDIQEAATSAVVAAIQAAQIDIGKIVFEGGADDLLGVEFRLFSFEQLRSSSGPVAIDMSFTGDEARYRVRGTVTAS